MDASGIQVKSSTSTPKVLIDTNGLTINNGSITIKAADGNTMITGTQINASYITTGTLLISGTNSPQIKVVQVITGHNDTWLL